MTDRRILPGGSVGSNIGDRGETPASLSSISSVSTAASAESRDHVHVVLSAVTNSSSPLEFSPQEFPIPPITFRQHLVLAKTEDMALEKLYNDIELRKSPSEPIGSDKGSKTNLLYVQSQDDIAKISSIPTAFDELNLAARISLQEVLSGSYKGNSDSEKLLICKNATLPVLGLGHEDAYIITTVIEDADDSQKTIRLEITCGEGCECAEDFFLKMRFPYLNNFEPGSLVVIRNPILTESLLLQSDSNAPTICIRASKGNVQFLPYPSGIKPLFQTDLENTMSKLNTSSVSPPMTQTEEVTQKSKVSMWISSSCEAKLAADEWKQWGNDFSVTRLHCHALIAYNIAIRFDPNSLELASARSAALINLGLYSGALRDAEFITSQDPFNSGYILRKVNCLWGQAKYHQSLDYLHQLMEMLASQAETNSSSSAVDPELKKKNVFIQSIIVKTEKIMQQQNSPEIRGTNDRYFKGSPMNSLNHEPEYYKPVDVVEDTTATEKKTYVVTNQPIQAGQLLAISKAFSVVTLDPALGFLVDHNDELINTVIQKFEIDKPSQSEFYKRDSENTEVEGEASEPEGSMEVTKEQMKGFFQKHFYHSHPTITSGKSKSTLEGGTSAEIPKIVGGIWTFPRNIRHACVGGNAVWYTVGNLMFIRAIRDLGQGQEIVMAHIDPVYSYEIRSQFLNDKGLSCFCPLCQFEKTESDQIKAKRDKILNHMRIFDDSASSEKLKDLSSYEMRKIQYFVEDLIVLRSAFAKLNFPIVEPLYIYGNYLMSVKKFDEAISNFEKAFFVVDNTSAVFSLVNISMSLAFCYMAKKNKDKGKARKWFSAVKSYAMLSYGCLEPIKASFRPEFEFLERKGIASLKP